MAMLPLIIVVGGDDVALHVCEELCGTEGHEVVLLWNADERTAAKAREFGATFIGLPPNDYESLRTAGVMHAASIMTLADDDRLNLQIALKARDLNPSIRLVLRQFNRTLARKIEQNLPDCSVVSLSTHSAATFAGAAVDRSCFSALQFPDYDGPLMGFSERLASEFQVAGLSVADAERRLQSRIISVQGSTAVPLDRVLRPEDRVIAFGPMMVLKRAWPDYQRSPGPKEIGSRFSDALRDAARAFRRTELVLKVIFSIGLFLWALEVVYFVFSLHLSPLAAAYFVTTTMATVGYGDITPLHAGGLPMLAAMLMMVSGVVLGGIFIAAVSSSLTRAQWVSVQGLRKVRGRNYIVVCGSGNVGLRVVEFLLELKERVVVVEQNPDPVIIERARDRQFELLTGDATREATLNFCNLERAQSLVALTDSDTANLEVALSARAKSAHLCVVMRIMDPAFAHSIGRQFQVTKSFSTTALTAPAFAGLSRFPGTRGRVSFDGEDYTIGERLQGDVPAPPPADFCIPLFVWRDGQPIALHDFAEMKPYDRLLFIVPLSQFRAHAPRRALEPAVSV